MSNQNGRKRIEKYLLSLPVGTRFTVREIAKKFDQTPMAVGDYLKEHIGVIIEREIDRSGCYPQNPSVYVRTNEQQVCTSYKDV